MEDLSLHILDIAENSIEAGATLIEIEINEDTGRNLLQLKITDNGRGLDEAEQQAVMDPFYTTKGGKPVGLGIPMLAQSAKEAGGQCTIHSQKGSGTVIEATFIHDHIDRKPLGNIEETLSTLIVAGGGQIDIDYTHRKDGAVTRFDTRKDRQQATGNRP